MKQWIGSASTLEEAILTGLKYLGLLREQVNVDVLEEKTSKLFSMMGFQHVRVRLTERTTGALRPKPNPHEARGPLENRPKPFQPSSRDFKKREKPYLSDRPDRQRNRFVPGSPPSGKPPAGQIPPLVNPPRAAASLPKTAPPLPDRVPAPNRAAVIISHAQSPEEMMSLWKEWLGWSDLEWQTETRTSGPVKIHLKTSDGKKWFPALESLEHLSNILLNRGVKQGPRVQLEVEGFTNPKLQRVLEEAQRAAEEVRRTGQLYRLEPMDAPERRAVHQALANNPNVETASEGEGPWRKVVVRPKTGGQGARAGGR